MNVRLYDILRPIENRRLFLIYCIVFLLAFILSLIFIGIDSALCITWTTRVITYSTGGFFKVFLALALPGIPIAVVLAAFTLTGRLACYLPLSLVTARALMLSTSIKMSFSVLGIHAVGYLLILVIPQNILVGACAFYASNFEHDIRQTGPLVKFALTIFAAVALLSLLQTALIFVLIRPFQGI